LELYVENVDAMFRRALSAGAQRSLEPANMFWGDRYAQVTDPFGYVWGIATHIEDVSHHDEVQRAHDYWLALAGGGA
jgi:PhnB protein